MLDKLIFNLLSTINIIMIIKFTYGILWESFKCRMFYYYIYLIVFQASCLPVLGKNIDVDIRKCTQEFYDIWSKDERFQGCNPVPDPCNPNPCGQNSVPVLSTDLTECNCIERGKEFLPVNPCDPNPCGLYCNPYVYGDQCSCSCPYEPYAPPGSCQWECGPVCPPNFSYNEVTRTCEDENQYTSSVAIIQINILWFVILFICIIFI